MHFLVIFICLLLFFIIVDNLDMDFYGIMVLWMERTRATARTMFYEIHDF